MRLFFSAPLVAAFCLTALSRPQPAAAAAEDSTLAAPQSWFHKIALSGTLSGDFRWQRRLDPMAESSGAASDLYLRKMELGIESTMSSSLSVLAVINTEYLGDEMNPGDNTLKIDEVHFDLHVPRLPLYFVVGRRTQPFGLFENYVSTDPMTQDAYSTNVVGATAGYGGPMNLDVSFTLYKGSVLMDQLFGSGLFDAGAVERVPSENHVANSYVASATIAPWSDYLAVFGAFLSEPSSDRRDTSLDVGLSVKVPRLENLLFDGEYARAIQRETYSGLDRPFEEAVLSVTGSYHFVVRPRSLRGSGNYKNRKSYTHAHPFLVAGRFEYFDDDALTETAGAWTEKYRYSAGLKYTMVESGDVVFYGMAEYRGTSYRVPADTPGADLGENNEIYLRAAFDF